MRKAKVIITFLQDGSQTRYSTQIEGEISPEMLLHSVLALANAVTKILNKTHQLESGTPFMEIEETEKP